jgi:hypothetical protein
MVEEGIAAADIASKQKHSPARDQCNVTVAPAILPQDLVSDWAGWSGWHWPGQPAPGWH